MKKMTKTMMTGAIAASLLFGAAYLQTDAYAATDSNSAATNSSDSTAKVKEGRFHKGTRGAFADGKHGFNLLSSTAELLQIEESELQAELKNGKTLVEIAEAKGLSKADYVSKLVEKHSQTIDDQVSAGTITQERADAMESGLTERLTQAVEGNHMGRGAAKGSGRHDMGFGFGKFGNSEALTEVLNISSEELKAALAEGKSIAELAQSKGMSEADLIEKLKEKLTEPIKTWVNKKHAPKAP
jgi:uncharacterized protein YidB (DUF937 family)